jgi:hypothetical protein
MNKVPENKRSFRVGDFMPLRVMVLKLRMKHFQRIYNPVIKTLRKPPKSNTKIKTIIGVAERFLSLLKEPDCKKPRPKEVRVFIIFSNQFEILGLYSIRLMLGGSACCPVIKCHFKFDFFCSVCSNFRPTCFSVKLFCSCIKSSS